MPSPPANDNWQNAILLSALNGGVTGTNAAATAQTGEPAGGYGKSVWYKFQWQPAPAAQGVPTNPLPIYDNESYSGITFFFTTRVSRLDDPGNPGVTNFDTVINLFDGSSGAP